MTSLTSDILTDLIFFKNGRNIELFLQSGFQTFLLAIIILLRNLNKVLIIVIIKKKTADGTEVACQEKSRHEPQNCNRSGKKSSPVSFMCLGSQKLSKKKKKNRKNTLLIGRKT